MLVLIVGDFGLCVFQTMKSVEEIEIRDQERGHNTIKGNRRKNLGF